MVADLNKVKTGGAGGKWETASPRSKLDSPPGGGGACAPPDPLFSSVPVLFLGFLFEREEFGAAANPCVHTVRN